MRSEPNPALNEFLVRLIGTFKDKDVSELATLAMSSAPELCEGRSHSAVYQCIRRLMNQTKRADREDIEKAKQLLKGLPQKNEVSSYDLAVMRVQHKPMRNK